ncbi:MAG TPA: DUF4372 domain-containing protein, partial [Dehalococcoidales bacterium]|nr:DUF4372 domain-containing protein [Dehalococcoidales bacterium]
DYAVKGFSSRGQFVAMLFCQFGRAHSLREICGGLAGCEEKLRHPGVSVSPKRSTLAYANANRPWTLYQTVFEQLLSKCQLAVAGRGVSWFIQLTLHGVYFVTRLKDNASFDVVEDRPVPASSGILKDQIIFFHHRAVPDQEYFFRIIEIWDEEKQRSFTFLTNNMRFAASTIAAIYKDRWKVKLFFKAIKQNLKIKTFLCTNPNAVRTQIRTALIAMLVLRYLQLMSTFGWSLSNLVALLRHQLFVYRDIRAWLNKPFEGPPQLADVAKAQLTLGFSS